MKRMIYQVYLGNENNLYNFCISSVERYCKKYDIIHIIQREPILEVKPDVTRTNRSSNSISLGYLPIYEKENAFSYLNDYDQIMILDSDIFIKDNAPNIFDDFDLSYDFGAVIESDMKINEKYQRKIKEYSIGQYSSIKTKEWVYHDKTGYEFMNMGMILLNKSILNHLRNETPKEFITRPEFKDFVDGIGNWKWSTDQTLLNYWIRKNKIIYKRMSYKWNGLYTAIENINEVYFIHFFLKDHLPNKGNDIHKIDWNKI